MNVEQGTLIPLVFTVLRAMGQENEKYHKNLVDKISTKSKDESVMLQITYVIR